MIADNARGGINTVYFDWKPSQSGCKNAVYGYGVSYPHANFVILIQYGLQPRDGESILRTVKMLASALGSNPFIPEAQVGTARADLPKISVIDTADTIVFTKERL